MKEARILPIWSWNWDLGIGQSYSQNFAIDFTLPVSWWGGQVRILGAKIPGNYRFIENCWTAIKQQTTNQRTWLSWFVVCLIAVQQESGIDSRIFREIVSYRAEIADQPCLVRLLNRKKKNLSIPAVVNLRIISLFGPPLCRPVPDFTAKRLNTPGIYQEMTCFFDKAPKGQN